MSRNSKLISDNLREEIAKELGVYEQVKQDGGWQNVSSQKCGNIVTKAIEIANKSVEKQRKLKKQLYIKKYNYFYFIAKQLNLELLKLFP